MDSVDYPPCRDDYRQYDVQEYLVLVHFVPKACTILQNDKKKMLVDDDHQARVILQLHAPKLYHAAPDRNRRCAHILTMNDEHRVALDADFVVHDVDDVKEALDVDNRTVQFLLHQLMNYDPSTHMVAGVVMPSGDVVSHVIARPRRARKKPSSMGGARSRSA